MDILLTKVNTMYRKYRYQEDLTAHNIDNLIENEVQTSEGVSNGVIVPTYTPFYSEGLIVRTATATMVRGRDYLVGELASQITSVSGHEASNTIIILKPQLEEYTITYQCVGGPYLNIIPIVAEHDGIVYDGPVDWHTILNTPDLYPPLEHPHELDDVIGWGYLVEALERVRQAIVMSNIPAYEKLIEWVSDTIENYPRANCRDIAWGDPIKKSMSLGMYHLQMETNPVPKKYRIKSVRRMYGEFLRYIRFRINTVNVTDGIRLLPIIKFSKPKLDVLTSGNYAYCSGGMMQLSVPIHPAVQYGEGWHVTIKLVNVYDNELDLCDMEYEYDDLPLGRPVSWIRNCRGLHPFNPIAYYFACK